MESALIRAIFGFSVCDECDEIRVHPRNPRPTCDGAMAASRISYLASRISHLASRISHLASSVSPYSNVLARYELTTTVIELAGIRIAATRGCMSPNMARVTATAL